MQRNWHSDFVYKIICVSKWIAEKCFIKVSFHKLGLERHYVWSAWSIHLCMVHTLRNFRVELAFRLKLHPSSDIPSQSNRWIQMPTNLRKHGSRSTFFIGMTKLSHKISFWLAVGHDCWFSFPIMLLWCTANGVPWDKRWAIEGVIIWMLGCELIDVICHSSSQAYYLDNWVGEWLY